MSKHSTTAWTRGAGPVAVLALALAITVVAPPSSAEAARGRTADEAAAEAQLLSHHNAARGGAGALQRSGDLDAIARAWADSMAANGTLRHNPNFRSQVKNWSQVAENVAFRRDSSLTPVQLAARMGDAYLASPGHRSNILSPAHTQVGIGMSIAADGSLWNTVVFRSPAGTSSGSSGGSSQGGDSSSPSTSTANPSSASDAAGSSAPETSNGPGRTEQRSDASSGPSRTEQERSAAEEQRLREQERERVRSFQTTLAELGWYDGAVDGLLGPLTERALSDFQAAMDLPISGATDDVTQAALQDGDVPTRAEHEAEQARQQRMAAARAAQSAAVRAWLADHTAADLASQQQARELLLAFAAQRAMPDHLVDRSARSTALAADTQRLTYGKLLPKLWLRGD